MIRILMLCAALLTIHAHADTRWGEGRERPLIAVIGENRMTELADFVVPYGVLKRSAVAHVVSVATRPGPIQMLPALRVAADFEVATFDERYPQGADFVIVPAVHYSRDPLLLAWISAQAAKGARLVAICDGVIVLAEAGLPTLATRPGTGTRRAGGNAASPPCTGSSKGATCMTAHSPAAPASARPCRSAWR